MTFRSAPIEVFLSVGVRRFFFLAAAFPGTSQVVELPPKKQNAGAQQCQNFEYFQQSKALANGSFPLFQFAEQIYHPLNALLKTARGHGPGFGVF
jgi:hypothetical protein